MHTESTPPLSHTRPPPAGETLPTPAFVGAAESLATARLAQSGRRVLFVARDALAAAHLAEEIAFFAPRLPVSLLPDWEVLPYDSASPPKATVSARIAALMEMTEGGAGATVVAAATAQFPFPPPSFVVSRAFDLRVGAPLKPESLAARLIAGGYSRVERVRAPGEFAVYGGQMDVFAAAAESPFRLVLFDDEIEQIRLFDPHTQRSTGRTDSIRTLPASECDLSAEGIARFRRQFTAHFGFGDEHPMVRQIRRGEPAPGREFLLPLFFEQSARVLDYLPPDAVVLTHASVAPAMEEFTRQVRQRQKIAAVYENRPVLPAAGLFWRPEAFFTAVRRFSHLHCGGDGAVSAPPPLAVNHRAAHSHRPLARFIQSFDGKVVLTVDGEGRRESLRLALAAEGVQVGTADSFAAALSDECKATATVAAVRDGFVCAAEKLALLTEGDIFQVRLPPKRHRQKAAAEYLHLGEIRAGDRVAHRDCGVGVCRGLQTMTAGGVRGEFLEIEYAAEQRLWLPVSQCYLLSRHHGGGELSKLGGAGWRRARRRAQQQARDTAAELLEVHARRLAAPGVSYRPDERDMARFAAGFAFEETPDQEKCIREVLADLRADQAMDRLVAADVGFGKTEIAMRAAAAVGFCGAQTALLAPTTLLAEQHARTFADRFAAFPLRVASLTRLTAARDKKRLLEELAAGKIDIIIGTHTLLQKTAQYRRLGLVIIDEEHRFGVRHKEYFKSLRANTDILSLSATPIPRTLGMAMDGLRDLSLLSTPPPSRLAVNTVIAPLSRALICDACERELLRGGQVYFVHNEIRTLAQMAEQLAHWLPRLRIAVAHGKMAAAELESAMRRFLHLEADLLLCTTIVESGLDITTANTMIVHRADRMGLSRLHQLRGRVGRAHHQAFAYFLTPPEGAATKDGEARLDALSEYSQLGSGFVLAMRDLEIRGAGEILGERQSGDIAAVGVALYQKMLKSAAAELCGDKSLPPEAAAAVDFNAPMLLPQSYIHSPSERMRYYWRLSECDTEAAIDDLHLEWEDRFGLLPPEARLLLFAHRLRICAHSAGVERIAESGGEATIYFQKPPPCVNRLMEKIRAGECRPSVDSEAVTIPLDGDDPLVWAKKLREFLLSLTRDEKPATENEMQKSAATK